LDTVRGDHIEVDRWRILAERLILELEELRARVPDSLADGSMEEALSDAAHIFRGVKYNQQFVRRPYSTLSSEAELLYQLARALRMRMNHTGLYMISGVSHFNTRLDRFLEKARQTLGYHPRLPLSLYKEGRL